MATHNVIDSAQEGAAGAALARSFTAAHAAEVRHNVTAAHSICRCVALATEAQTDGSALFDDPQTSRWLPSIDAACERLRAVRTALTELGGAPNHDWWTPLNLLEALAAGMWNSHGPGQGQMDHGELVSFLAVAIESLDALLAECEAGEAQYPTETQHAQH